MLPFDSQNLFPLVHPRACSYKDEQEHSACVDAWLGIDALKIERDLIAREKKENLPIALASENPQQAWIGLAVDGLLTPYTEFRSILTEIDPRPGSVVVDLGAAYARMGFVLAEHYPLVQYIGYELVHERVVEAKRCLKEAAAFTASILQSDLSAENFVPEAADFYFIYDYGTRRAIDKTLDDLREIAVERKITVVGRGNATRDAIEKRHPWLSQIVNPRHFTRYSIYRSASEA